MKFQTLNWQGVCLLALVLTSCGADMHNAHDCYCTESISMNVAREFFANDQKTPKSIEKAQAIMPGNELEPADEGRDATFYCNPLLLNGKPLDYAMFSLASKGVLSVVEGNPESPNATKIPFLIYLRREGAIVGQGKDSPQVTEIEVSEILMFAQPGDHLIIDPVRVTDWKAKRIIKLVDGC